MLDFSIPLSNRDLTSSVCILKHILTKGGGRACLPDCEARQEGANRKHKTNEKS